MVNPYHGEVALTVDDQELTMRLSLGSLASLEAAMDEDSLLSLVERFETGQFKTRDLTMLLVAGLNGGGWQGSESELLAAHIKGGPLAAAKAAGQLLSVTFGMPE